MKISSCTVITKSVLKIFVSTPPFGATVAQVAQSVSQGLKFKPPHVENNLDTTSFRPAPMAWTSQAWPCLWCWSQLAGGMPPGPPGTHAWSQFWYSCLIPVFVHTSHLSSGVLLSSESSMLYLDLHLYHSTHFAWPCLARGTWSPKYTFFIPVLVHMFNPCFATNVLFKLSKLHFSLHQWHGTCCTQPACQGQAPWTTQSTCSIPVLTHTFYPNHQS